MGPAPGTPVRNAGWISAQVSDPVQGVVLALHVVYPTLAAAHPVQVGPYRIDAAMGAPVDGADLPLVLISHGTGGSSLTHRDLAIGLARAGRVVVLLEHAGNNRSDNSLEGTLANLENRPRHVRLAIDAILADSAIGPRLLDDSAVLIGHSMGGYTALAAAGGRAVAGAPESGQGQAVALSPDRRVKALVLLAPACGWFGAHGALAGVDVPILLRTAEHDALAHHLHAHLVTAGVRDPARVDFQVVPNAGHHSFQSPFPASMTRPGFPPSQDPAGFDRAAYQPILLAEIVAFLDRAA